MDKSNVIEQYRMILHIAKIIPSRGCKNLDAGQVKVRERPYKAAVTGVKDLGGLQIQRCIPIGQTLFRGA